MRTLLIVGHVDQLVGKVHVLLTIVVQGVAFLTDEIIFHINTVLVLEVDEFFLHFKQIVDNFLLFTHDAISMEKVNLSVKSIDAGTITITP